MNMYRSIATAEARTERSAWEKKLDDRNAAKHAYDAFYAAIWLPMAEQLDRTSPRPDLFFEIEALNGQVARYFVPADDLHQWDDHWSPLYRRKAAAVRDAWLAYRATCEQLGWDDAGKEVDRLCEIQCDIEAELILTPAPDQAALMWKLDHLFGAEARDEDDYSPAWCPEWINTVMEDARRLLRSEDSRPAEQSANSYR